MRGRILDAAMDCFARKGFSGTTVADIEAAAGFSPRAGGTYRHFPSKRAMLEAAIDRATSASDDELAPEPTSLEAAAEDGLAELDRHRSLMRVMFRDLDQFPDLMDRVVDRLLEGPCRLVAERTAAVAPDVDAEAVALLLIGGLINYKVIETLVGKRPASIDEDRVVKAWASLYEAAVRS